MYRWLLMGSITAMLVGSTGCLHHNVRGGNNCPSGNCNATTNTCNDGSCGGCNDCNDGAPVGLLSRLKHNHSAQACNNGGGCNCGKSGLIGRLGSAAGVGGCKNCNGGCRTGCQAGPLGWQQGGLDYSSHLNPGVLGHQAGNALNNRAVHSRSTDRPSCLPLLQRPWAARASLSTIHPRSADKHAIEVSFGPLSAEKLPLNTTVL